MKFERPEFCSQCEQNQNCELLDLFQKEDEAYRSEIGSLESLKKLPGTDKVEIVKKQKKLIREHIEYVDTVWTHAQLRKCPNVDEFKA